MRCSLGVFRIRRIRIRTESYRVSKKRLLQLLA